MTEQEYHDLLIRLDMRQKRIEESIEKIEQFLSNRLCKTHAEKIRTLEKITWGAVAAAMASIIKSFWN